MKSRAVYSLVAMTIAGLGSLAIQAPSHADTFVEEIQGSSQVVGPGVKEYGYTTTITTIPDSTRTVITRTVESPAVVESPSTLVKALCSRRVIESPVLIQREIRRPVYVDRHLREVMIGNRRHIDQPVVIYKKPRHFVGVSLF